MTPSVPSRSPVAEAHALPATEVAARLSVDPTAGLASADAAARLASAGPNELEAHEPPSVLHLFVEAATEPFVIALGIAGILAIVLGEVRDGLLVLAGLVPIVGADVATEYRGERALERLRDAAAPRAQVRRDGALTEVMARELVPGDVVALRVGDVVPADVRLVRSDALTLDRAILTGESLPEPARVEPDAADAVLAERHSIAYSGTPVVLGRGEGVVVATGPETELGRIAAGLEPARRGRSPLQRELDRLVGILLGVAIALIFITVGLNLVRGSTLGEAVLAGISAAIAAIPEEPPVLLAVILGMGAYRLLHRGVLVRRLNAQETLGAIDLIVTDKTGTLTENRLALERILVLEGGAGAPEVELDSRGPELESGAVELESGAVELESGAVELKSGAVELESGAVEPSARARRELLEAAIRAEDDAWTSDPDARLGSFTRALADAAGADAPALDPADLVSAVPAGDGRPWSTTLAARPDGRLEQLALGAPESILELAGGNGVVAAWTGVVERTAAAGRRLLLLAGRLDDEPWRPRALFVFSDPIRAGVADALRTATEAGIQTVVVTGDHPTTAATIGRAAGIETGRAVTGADIQAMSEAELAAALPGIGIVARAAPADKLRLVTSARAAGRLVAVTGDGVNDAPALQRSDVGVAMGSGTAVAKEAADLVLGDDSFATLMHGLAEGRRIVSNVKKGLVFLVSTHVALLGFILIATLAGIGQPLLPIQILWLELFIDLSTSIAFEREPAEPDSMTTPPRPSGKPLLTNALLGRITLAGSITAVAALALALSRPDDPDHARWLAFNALVFGQVVRAYANRSLRWVRLDLTGNRVLLFACLIVVAIQVAIPHVPFLAEAFRASTLSGWEWAAVAVIALVPAAGAIVIRRMFRTEWVA